MYVKKKMEILLWDGVKLIARNRLNFNLVLK